MTEKKAAERQQALKKIEHQADCYCVDCIMHDWRVTGFYKYLLRRSSNGN